MKLKQRKLFITLLFFATATALCLLKMVEGSELLQFYVWLGGLYFAGNVGTKISNGHKPIDK